MFQKVCPEKVFRPLSFANILIYLLTHRQACLPMAFLFVREQIPVKIDSRDLPQVGLLVHGCLTHKQDDRFLVGHGPTHPRNPPEVLLQPLYPVRGVDHGLDSMIIVQVSEIRLIGSILAASPDASVIPAPFGTEPLPLVPGLFHGIVPVSCAEDLSQVVSHIPFVTVADIAQYVALQVGGASLETGAGKHFADDIIVSIRQTTGIKFYIHQ